MNKIFEMFDVSDILILKKMYGKILENTLRKRFNINVLTASKYVYMRY